MLRLIIVQVVKCSLIWLTWNEWSLSAFVEYKKAVHSETLQRYCPGIHSQIVFTLWPSWSHPEGMRLEVKNCTCWVISQFYLLQLIRKRRQREFKVSTSDIAKPLISHFTTVAEYKSMERVNLCEGVCRCRGGTLLQDVFYASHSFHPVKRGSCYSVSTTYKFLNHTCAERSMEKPISVDFQYERRSAQYVLCGWLNLWSFPLLTWRKSEDELCLLY